MISNDHQFLLIQPPKNTYQWDILLQGALEKRPLLSCKTRHVYRLVFHHVPHLVYHEVYELVHLHRRFPTVIQWIRRNFVIKINQQKMINFQNKKYLPPWIYVTLNEDSSYDLFRTMVDELQFFQKPKHEFYCYQK